MKFPPLVGMRHGKRVVSRRGICVMGLVVSTLSMGGFLAGRFAFDLMFGSTVGMLPGLLFSAIMPVGVVLGKQLRFALSLPAEELPTLR